MCREPLRRFPIQSRPGLRVRRCRSSSAAAWRSCWGRGTDRGRPPGCWAGLVKPALRTGRTQRNPQARKPIEDRNRFKAGMINISERPKEADDRAIPGHWEGDLILGSTASSSAIGTLVERTTGFVVLLHLPEDRTAATLADTMSAKVPEIPEILRRSLTW